MKDLKKGRGTMKNAKILACLAAAALAATFALAACSGQSSAPAPADKGSEPAAAAPAAPETTSEPAAAPAESAAAPAEPAATSEPAAAPADATAAPAQPAADARIGDEAAIEIALQDAGFTQADVVDLSCELDLDDAIVHYDVDFKQGGMEYDYDIDAATGEILVSNAEVDD